MVQAWIIDPNHTGDQREAAKTNPVQEVSLNELAQLGVLYWKIDVTGVEQDPTIGKLGEIRAQRSYKNYDIVCVHPDKLPNYDDKIKMFYAEHLHEDEEIRLCLEGSGYFDVRSDITNAWIRVAVVSGDLIVLPAGMYHRFTTDVSNYIKAMRLFQDAPKWEAINRGSQADGTSARSKYLSSISLHKSVDTTSYEQKQGVNGISYVIHDGAKALAKYPHMRKINGMLYVSGMSSRQPDNSFRGVTVSADGTKTYDCGEQTCGVIENIKKTLAAAGADLTHVVECVCFLKNMKDYASFNNAYNKYFDTVSGPTRTTVAVTELPHPDILIEIKAIAVDPASLQK